MNFSPRLLLALQLVGFFVTLTNAANLVFKEGVNGQTCFTQSVPFSSSSFSYTLQVIQPLQLASNCSASDIFLSPLYMSGTCLQTPDNSKSGCPSGTATTTTASGSTSTSGESVPVSSTTAVCNQAFSLNNREVPLEAASIFDSNSVRCAPSKNGYFYIQNNCAASTGQSIIQIQVYYVTTSYSCSGSSYYYDSTTWNNWPVIFGVIAGVFVLTFTLLFLCGRRRRAQMQQQNMAAVQMMPPPPPPAMGMPYGAPQGGPPPPYGGGYSAPPPTGYPAPVFNTSQPTPYPSQPQTVLPQSTGEQPQANQSPVWYAGGKPPAT